MTEKVDGATSFSLYEINKEIFDGLEDGMGQEAQIPIGKEAVVFELTK